jgi:phospholipase C
MLEKIRHLVVLLLENRSFDNMLGYAYDSRSYPRNRIPNDARVFFGPDFDPSATKPGGGDYWNPSNPAFFDDPGADPIKVPLAPAPTDDFRSPNPDPGEHFDRITAQIFGPKPPSPGNNQMLGFLLDYAQNAGTAGAAAIMRYYTPSHVPVITGLGRTFAICDRWFAASPTQTLPNRSFVHTGTSCGKVNNRPYNPFDFNVPTIFNVLDTLPETPWNDKVTWKVYKDSSLHLADLFPGTRVQFPHLWSIRNPESHFLPFENFQADADDGSLPTYSFIEPRLILDGNDQHPPRDIRPGEKLMHEVYQSIRTSRKPEEILLVITYDEHGGCYDHVPPPFGAVAPEPVSPDSAFKFDRYGVRLPAVLVSPYIEEGTVFRSTKQTAGSTPVEVPFDHTSILATLRDWLQIPSRLMLPSKRIADAPTFGHVLTLTAPRIPMPDIGPPRAIPFAERIDLHMDQPSNDLEISFAMALTAMADGVAARDPMLESKLKDHEFLVRHVIQQLRQLNP